MSVPARLAGGGPLGAGHDARPAGAVPACDGQAGRGSATGLRPGRQRRSGGDASREPPPFSGGSQA